MSLRSGTIKAWRGLWKKKKTKHSWEVPWQPCDWQQAITNQHCNIEVEILS